MGVKSWSPGRELGEQWIPPADALGHRGHAGLPALAPGLRQHDAHLDVADTWGGGGADLVEEPEGVEASGRARLRHFALEFAIEGLVGFEDQDVRTPLGEQEREQLSGGSAPHHADARVAANGRRRVGPAGGAEASRCPPPALPGHPSADHLAGRVYPRRALTLQQAAHRVGPGLD